MKLLKWDTDTFLNYLIYQEAVWYKTCSLIIRTFEFGSIEHYVVYKYDVMMYVSSNA